MKIIIEHLGMKVSAENEAAVDICDAVDLFEETLLKVGYQQERIDGGFIVKAKQVQGEL